MNEALGALVLSVVAIVAAAQRADADESGTSINAVAAGTIVGVVTNAAKAPIGGATVTATRAGGGIRSTVSGSDGVYSFADVAPGAWSITVQVEGYPDAGVPSLQVVASKASRRDVVMNIPAAAAVAAAASPAPAPAPATPATTASASAAQATVPEALQAPAPGPDVDLQTPWADVGYVGWLNGTPREKTPIFDTKFFTPEIRLDMNYLQSGNHPIDHTIVGSTEEFRSGEVQSEQGSFGGDFHWDK